MKIAFDARAARENVTGIGRIILETALGLSQKGHEITLIYDGEPSFKLEGSNLNHVSLGSGGRFLWEQRTLKNFLEKNDFDIFHEFWNFGVPFFYRKDSVLTIHDLIPKVWAGYFNLRNIRLRATYELSLGISISKARKILVDSESTKKDLLKFFPKVEEKTLVCYAGVNHKINSTNSSTNLEIPQGNYFVYFGGIDPRKNIDLLIKAFAQIRNRNLQAKLIVVGNYIGNYDGLVKSLGLENNVLFPGFLSQDSLENLLASSVGVVYPSSYEGFGFPILEAQKAGTAVITAETSSLIEIAADSALLVKPNFEEIAEAMAKLLSDKNLRQDLIKRGNENIKRFNWEKTVSQVEKVYREVLNG